MISVSGYTIKEELYSGEKSRVYRALKDGIPVILKVLHNEYPDPTELNAFRQEYETLKKLQSPGIVKTLGLEKYKNSFVIVFEDIGGEALSLILAEVRKFPMAEILDVMTQATRALSEVHRLNLVHKDIKSHNIIFNKETRKLQIIDFGNASLLAKQNTYTPLNSSIEGTLAYISPEQTGRMNRTVDYRTDYYSLGVTFYQILTGELPFTTSDPMELVHAHIAKMPTPPKDSGLQPTGQRVADPLSDIVMKLLQKNPEDRYQSIAGLVYDLEWCLNLTPNLNPLTDLIDKVPSPARRGEAYLDYPNSVEFGERFQIGTHDFSGKFQIPEKLYGRTTEIQQIIDTFQMVAAGNVELMLISGRSGIGKSALINEVNKPITQYKGYFASGKYDPFKRAIPFHAIGQAFQSLIQQILTGSQSEIDIWKKNLLGAVGQNGQVIVDIIPELENLIGKQPAVIELGSSESQNRFNLVFQNFIQAFCIKEHPIAIFLDDMQWADSPSINLIQTILSNPEMKYLYLMLSFRDNEVLATDSFSMMLESLKKAGFTYKEILLEPIGISDITHLVSDTLNCEESKAQELAKVLFEKTKGNPFFVNELFTSFYKDELVYLDNGLIDSGLQPTVQSRPTVLWNWDISKIRESKISENVIDLMVEKVQELTPSQIELLKLAACVGDSFELDTFFQLANQEIDMVNRELTVISNEGFLLLTKNQVRFVHDKVREATYSLISEDDRAKKHYAIGKSFLVMTKPEEIEENVFTIVNQLNQGLSFMSKEEKVKLIDLNILAGDKAFASSAHDAALGHFRISFSLLSLESWEDNYNLTINIYSKLARLEYLTGNHAEADKYFDLTLNKAKTMLEKISVYETKIQLFTSRNQLREALSIGMQALELLGVTFPEVHDPAPEIGKSFQLMEKRKVSELLDGNLNFEQTEFAILRLLAGCVTAAYISLPSLFPLIVMKIVNISLESGNFVVSPIGYAFYGNILCSAVGNYELGHAFGKLAMDLVDKYNLGFLKSTVYFIYSTMINHWKNHAIENLDYLMEAHQAGIVNGNLQFAAYSINHYNFQSLLMRRNLSKVISGFEKHSPVFKKMNQLDAFLMFNLNRQLALNLSSAENNPISLKSEIFDEENILQHWMEAKNSTTLFNYYINKSMLHFLFGSPLEAYRYAREGEPHEGGCFGMMFVAEHNFWDSLTCLILLESPDSSELDKAKYQEQVSKNQLRMKVWAENCPTNYGHKFHIVKGRLAAYNGEFEKSRKEYKEAIRLAKENEYVLEEALANELYAKLWHESGEEQYENIHLLEAHYAYKKWGCDNKVKQLEEKYPQLKRQASRGNSTYTSISSSQSSTDDPTISSNTTSIGSSTTGGSFLDLNTVVKASQALSGEIYLGRLLEKMMKILFENAGAEKGFFILKEKDKLFIEAEGNASTGSISVLEEKPLEDNENLSPNIVNYVVRTKSIVLLNDAVKKGMFVNDTYVKGKQPKSILCYPVINQGNLVGVVYLENNLTTDAFTPDRVEILKILSSQIAVSVENSLLYANLEEKVEERTRDLNNALVEVRGLKEKQDGDYFLNTLLIEPLGQNNTISSKVEIDFFIKQKKTFIFRKNEHELGGDINISESMELMGKPYTVFLNGDAMGKSIQGAGGVLVLGTVFKSIIQRTKATSSGKNIFPERWLKNAFIEMHKAFESFDGSMLMSAAFGLIDENSGTMYFMNAEHPDMVLYRDGLASFIENPHKFTKLGSQGQSGSISVSVYSLRPDDVVILGSDGRDDVILGKEKETGYDIINQDPKLFLYHVKHADGDLEAVYKEITATGKLMDDLSLLKIHFKGVEQDKRKMNEDLKLLEEYKEEGKFEKFAEVGIKLIADYPHLTNSLFEVSLVLKEIRQYDQAIDLGERLRLRDAKNVANLMNLAESYHKVGKKERANSILDSYLKMYPNEERLKKLRDNS